MKDEAMNKEQFVKQITQVMELDQKCKKIATLVNDLFCEGSTTSVVDLHYPVTESHIENIATLSGIDKDEIEAFLWDNVPCSTKYTKDGIETIITNPEELWDYLKA